MKVDTSDQMPAISGQDHSCALPLRHFIFLIGFIFLLEIIFASGKELFGRIHFGLHGPGGYWAFQWPRDYSHGFVRRGLLGEIVRRIGLDNANYLTVTLISWLISFALFLLLARSTHCLIRGFSADQAILLTLILLLSPTTTGMLIEIVGDPLLTVLLLYLLLHLLLTSFTLHPVAEFALCAFFGAFSVLIHEASLFFFAPAFGIVCLLLRSRRDYAAVTGYLAGAIPAVLFTVLATQHNAPTAIPALHWRGIQAFAAADQYPSFSTLIATDNAANFGHGFYGVVKMIYRFVSCLLLPSFIAFLLVRYRFGRSQADLRKATLTVLLPAICCLPLFLIAHDWGRFFAIQMMLIITHLAAWKPAGEIRPFPFRTATLGIGVLIAGITTTPVALTYRVLGLSDSRAIFAASTVAIIGALLLSRRQTHFSGEFHTIINPPVVTNLFDESQTFS